MGTINSESDLRGLLPSSGELLRSLTDPAFDAEAYDAARAERYARREGMY